MRKFRRCKRKFGTLSFRNELEISSSATIDKYLHQGMPGHNGVSGARGERGKANRYFVAADVEWMRENAWQKPAADITDGPDFAAVKLEGEKVMLNINKEDLDVRRRQRERDEGQSIDVEPMERLLTDISGLPGQGGHKMQRRSRACGCYDIFKETLHGASSNVPSES